MSPPDPRAVVYDPYLHTLGGAERYAWETASLLMSKGYETVLAGPVLPSQGDVVRYGLDSSVPLATLNTSGFLRATRGAAVSVWVDNAVPRPSLARRRLAVLSFPFQDLRDGLSGWLRRSLLSQVDDVIVYSEFARSWTEQRWGVGPRVCPPPVTLRSYERARKAKLILGVGRFFPSAHSKRQDVLIEAFAQLVQKSGGDGVRLALAGGLDSHRPHHLDWYEQLVTMARGLPIDFYPSVDNTDLSRLFEQASIFWHAAGFQRDPDQPERAEHFGITTVEAMSAGAIPMVYADGGQLEIVTPDLGVLWRSVDDLVARTSALLSGDLDVLAHQAVIRSRAWDRAAFRQRFGELLD